MLRLAVLALGLLGAPVRADDLLTGNTLLAYCETKEVELLCTGYVSGVVEGFQKGVYANDGAAIFCLRDGVTRHQLEDVAIKYLREHPEQRHQNAAALVLLSVVNAFPCRR